MRTKTKLIGEKLLVCIGWLFSITAIADVQSEAQTGDSIPKAKRSTFSKGVGYYVFLYPYAWSKDGKFAYILEQRPGPLPICYTQYSVLITDTLTNTQLWNHTLTKGEESCEAWIAQDAPASLKKVRSELEPISTPQFKKHAIIQTDHAIHELPLPGVEQTLKLIVTREYSTDQLLFLSNKLALNTVINRFLQCQANTPG